MQYREDYDAFLYIDNLGPSNTILARSYYNLNINRSLVNFHIDNMKFSSELCVAASFTLTALATPVMEKRATPTIYLAGDSTMAKNGANDGATDGKQQGVHSCIQTKTGQDGANT